MTGDDEIRAEIASRNNERDSDQWEGSHDPWFVDVATELLAARKVIEAAESWTEDHDYDEEGRCPCSLCTSLGAYYEATR